ncbi:MAG: tol-pal system protein YbgF [Acidobacteria bacterium]|nr:MAG: tol-pal system protein YbgF [Acidobacteriota bacterium]
MKILRNPLFVIVLAGLMGTPAWAVNRELVELQTQVQQIQDQMNALKQSLDERMGVIKNLMDQNTDSINKVTVAITNMQVALQKQQSDTNNHVDQLSGQLQTLNDSLDELKARLGKVTNQLEAMQQAQQSLAAQASQQAQAQQQQQAQLAVPPPDVLYNNALRDYNGGNVDLAKQEFSDYVKNYPNTDLAGNAYFYLAELAFKSGDYPNAIKGYDQVLQSFPDGSKAASAELKKGLAQIESGQKDAGISTLRHVVQRYPRTNEAMQAKDRLRKLGVATAASRRAE